MCCDRAVIVLCCVVIVLCCYCVVLCPIVIPPVGYEHAERRRVPHGRNARCGGDQYANVGWPRSVGTVPAIRSLWRHSRYEQRSAAEWRCSAGLSLPPSFLSSLSSSLLAYSPLLPFFALTISCGSVGRQWLCSRRVVPLPHSAGASDQQRARVPSYSRIQAQCTSVWVYRWWGRWYQWCWCRQRRGTSESADDCRVCCGRCHPR